MSCNDCNNNSCDPCEKGCHPASYSCDFSIQSDPYDANTWLFNYCGSIHRIKLPKIPETCTRLSTNFSTKSLIYDSECGQQIITGEQLGSLIDLEDLRNVHADDADACSFLVKDPGACNECGDGCSPKDSGWYSYQIPRAEDTNCEMEPDENGFYKVLTLDDCGCMKECKLTVAGPVVADYHRDSVPDDPDWPWYYGQYNETIDLHLPQNSPYFGRTALKVTIIYGIQAIKPRTMANYNWRSLLVPTIKGEKVPVTTDASILQDDCSAIHAGSLVDNAFKDRDRIPWASKSMRGMITFLVPKGKEVTLHHEFRIRTAASEVSGGPGYAVNATYDGKRVPDNLVGAVDLLPYGASRLNALQVITEPATITKHMTPALDPAKSQLDPAVDEYPPLIIG